MDLSFQLQVDCSCVVFDGQVSQNEHAFPVQAVALHGKSWVNVAKMVSGRSEVQCRERWMNVLNPDVRNAAPFTPEVEYGGMDAYQRERTMRSTAKRIRTFSHVGGQAYS